MLIDVVHIIVNNSVLNTVLGIRSTQKQRIREKI